MRPKAIRICAGSLFAATCLLLLARPPLCRAQDSPQGGHALLAELPFQLSLRALTVTRESIGTSHNLKSGLFDIEAPAGCAVPAAIEKQITDALKTIGVPSGDGWRYVVLPEQDWQDTQRAYGPYLTDHSNTAYIYPLGKVVYLRERMFPLTEQTLLFTLAHELAHRYLKTTDEGKANAFAQNVVDEVRRYGRNNFAALMSAKRAKRRMTFQLQPTEANVPIRL